MSGPPAHAPAPGARIAVVVPCRDDGPFLADALGSLRGEEPHELVVVDNASQDPRTLRVLDALRAGGVRVVREATPGLAVARTRGLRETAARYVFALDADDRVEPGALARLADALDADPAAGAAWGDVRAFGAADHLTPTYRSLDPFLLAFVNRLSAGSLYRRAALEEVGGWTLRDGYEDWDLWLSLAEHGWSGVHVGGVTMHYRVHARPRMLATLRTRHDEVMPRLRARHPGVFPVTGHRAAASPAPRRLRLALRAIAAVPGLGDGRRARLYDVAIRTFDPGLRLVVGGRREPSPVRRALTRAR